MSAFDFADLELFITGPTYIRPDVRNAGVLPEFGHRDAENDKRFVPIFANLRALAGIPAGCGDYEVILYNGSGSTVLESAIRSLVADDETVLNVSVGAFGDLWHKMAQVNGKKARQYRFGWGRAVDLESLAAALEESRPGVVTITHNETSTGVTNDIVACCELVREYGALPLVDGVSIFGGVDVRLMEAMPALYATSTQKALGLPGGFGIAFVHQTAIAKAEKVANRGYASDILTQLGRARKNQTLTTPNTTLANQMCVQLDYIVHTEGMENRFARHAAMRDQLAAWLAGVDGYRFFAPEGHRAPTMTAIEAPAGVTPTRLKTLKEAMRAKGFLFDTGYMKMNDYLEAEGRPAVFRIGHMGDLTPAMLARYLDALEPELALVREAARS
ncbi:MAG: alanine--glyoxylate aminotransferase family protein [Desulfovibrionaceae bacterium]